MIEERLSDGGRPAQNPQRKEAARRLDRSSVGTQQKGLRMPHRMGFNVDKLEEFNKFAADNPNDVLLGITAKTIWDGEGGGSLAKIGPWEMAGNSVSKPTRDYSIQFGAWKEVEEALGVEKAMDRIEPVEVALAAVSACVNTAIAINAAREGVAYDGLEITTKAMVDPRVLVGVLPAEEAASCLQSVEMTIEVQGDVSDADKQKIADMAKRSPVHAMISNANNLVTTIT